MGKTRILAVGMVFFLGLSGPFAADPAKKTLWDRLGGEKNVAKVAVDFQKAAAADPKANVSRDGKFKLDEAGKKQRQRLFVEFLSSVTGGPLKYTGRSMKESHQGLAITAAEFDATTAHFKAALEKNGVKPADVAEVLKIWNGTRKDIVEAHGPKADMHQAIFKNYPDLKWDKILPDLGDSSPEICILHVDPGTKATKLLIRVPKGIHVRKHWHSANETHTMIAGSSVFACDGKRIEQGPGSFNYLPAKMVHEAWVQAGSLVFITVDGPWDVNWVDGAPTAADLIKK